MDEPRKFNAPVTLEPSPSGYGNEMVITGVRMSLFNLVGLFLKAWFAWLIASFIIFVLIVAPIWFVVSCYETGINEQRIKQILNEPIPR